ncbi:hypothetical protein [Candidatus Marithrix sp. Canyon 246]|nr:hypothetical protein [Candidatus Marithrix sp. Canyon 246]
MLSILISLEAFAASNIDTTDKYAWSESSGWNNFNDTNGDVTVYNDHLEGYVWAENVGLIRLGTHTSGGRHTYANSSGTDYGINNDDSGKLSGYAWAENVGWIHFKNTSPAYKVRQLSP